MRLTRVFQYCLFLSIIFTASCRKDASYVNFPEFKQKIVVEAYLSPDQDSNFIYISSTQNRFGELTGAAPSLGNLNLYFSDGMNEIKLDTVRKELYHFDSYKYYIKNIPVTEGKTYHLKVTSDKGLTAEANCTVPFKKDFKLEVDTSSIILMSEIGFKQSITYANFSITDIPGESNYYRLLYIYTQYSSLVEYPQNSIKKQLQGEVPVTNVYEPGIGDKVFSDIGMDGKKILLRSIQLPPVDLIDYPHPYAKVDSTILRVYLLNTDKPYYDFHHSLLNYSLGDTPFTEASFTYSNIKGGVGIFAAYTVDSLIFRLK